MKNTKINLFRKYFWIKILKIKLFPTDAAAALWDLDDFLRISILARLQSAKVHLLCTLERRAEVNKVSTTTKVKRRDTSCRRGQAWRHQSIRLGRPHSWVWYKYPIRRSHLIDTDQKVRQKLSHFAHLKIYHLNLFEKLCDTWIFFQWFCFQNIHCL